MTQYQPGPGFWPAADGRWYPPPPPAGPAAPVPARRRHRVWPWIAGAVIVGVVLGVALTKVGHGTGTRTTHLGQALSLRDKYNDEQASVTVTAVIDPAVPAAGTTLGFADDRFVAVDYTITNTGSVPIAGGDYTSPWLDDNPGDTVTLGTFTDCTGADAAVAPHSTVHTCAPFEIEKDEPVSVIDLQLGADDAYGRWTTS